MPRIDRPGGRMVPAAREKNTSWPSLLLFRSVTSPTGPALPLPDAPRASWNSIFKSPPGRCGKAIGAQPVPFGQIRSSKDVTGRLGRDRRKKIWRLYGTRNKNAALIQSRSHPRLRDRACRRREGNLNVRHSGRCGAADVAGQEAMAAERQSIEPGPETGRPSLRAWSKPETCGRRCLAYRQTNWAETGPDRSLHRGAARSVVARLVFRRRIISLTFKRPSRSGIEARSM